MAKVKIMLFGGSAQVTSEKMIYNKIAPILQGLGLERATRRVEVKMGR